MPTTPSGYYFADGSTPMSAEDISAAEATSAQLVFNNLAARNISVVADFTALAALGTAGKLAGDLAYVVEGAVYMSWTGTVWRQVATATFASTGARDAAYAKASAVYLVASARALDTSTGVESAWGVSEWVLDDTGWITPTMSSVWTAISGEEPGWRRVNGIVYLRGRASRSTGSNALFTLPVGFRPAMQIVVLLESNGAARRATLGPDGLAFGTLGSGAISALSVGSFPPFVADN